MFHSKSIKILKKWDGSNAKINMQAVPLLKVENGSSPPPQGDTLRRLWLMLY